VAFDKNTDLYKDPSLAEGADYARRHRRHERFDDSLARTGEVAKTTILAPHGGGIERGTSELCLAVAGYHPANLPITPPAGVTYDYWMFEGVRPDDNAPLHVPSIGCDDGVAVSLCAGALNALARAQRAAARDDVRRELPPAAQAHHHPGVLDLRGGVPRRARPARGRAGRALAWGQLRNLAV
jgi:hypothetical protein